MKLQDDLNNILISSYADTLRMVSGFVVLISQQFMQWFAAAVFPDTPSQISRSNSCVLTVSDIRCALPLFIFIFLLLLTENDPLTILFYGNEFIQQRQ